MTIDIVPHLQNHNIIKVVFKFHFFDFRKSFQMNSEQGVLVVFTENL
jgi:hypothetical protein